MNRRGFFSKLLGGGTGAIAVAALQPLMPIESVAEVKPKTKYVFKLNHYVATPALEHMRAALQEFGIDAVIMDPYLESIYELKP